MVRRDKILIFLGWKCIVDLVVVVMKWCDLCWYWGRCLTVGKIAAQTKQATHISQATKRPFTCFKTNRQIFCWRKQRPKKPNNLVRRIAETEGTQAGGVGAFAAVRQPFPKWANNVDCLTCRREQTPTPRCRIVCIAILDPSLIRIPILQTKIHKFTQSHYSLLPISKLITPAQLQTPTFLISNTSRISPQKPPGCNLLLLNTFKLISGFKLQNYVLKIIL